ncbi:MAG TPA: hypothetical protein VF607_04280 [Verrucomicrobiae bacterium]
MFGHSFRAFTDAQLFIDAADVVAHGMNAELHIVSNLPVGKPTGQPVQDFFLFMGKHGFHFNDQATNQTPV